MLQKCVCVCVVFSGVPTRPEVQLYKSSYLHNCTSAWAWPPMITPVFAQVVPAHTTWYCVHALDSSKRIERLLSSVKVQSSMTSA